MSEENSSEKGLIKAFLQTYDRLQTRKSYRHDLQSFFGETARGASPEDREDVTVGWAEALASGPEEVAGYLRRVAEEKGPSAARRRRAALRSFYRWLQDQLQKEEELQTGTDEIEIETEEAKAKINEILSAARPIEALLEEE